MGIDFDKLIEKFSARNKVTPTFYNKFLNAYTFCYTYTYKCKTKNLSFIVMEKEGRITCTQKYSLVKEIKKEVHSIEDLEKYFNYFLRTASMNENLQLCEA